MNEMLDRARSFTAPGNPADAVNIIGAIEKTVGSLSPSIKTLEAVLKHYKDQLKRILEKDLVAWMNENEQVNFETETLKVALRTHVSAKMMDDTIGFKWLIENQYGDLIKDTLKFPKGEFNKEAEAALIALGLSYEQTCGVAPPSLKKIMKDRLEAGEMLPDEEGDGIKVSYHDECVVREK